MNQFTNHQTSGDDCRESGEGETSRRQFEEYFEDAYGWESHEYPDQTYVAEVWSMWQASRAAIEIHLPGAFRESYQSSNMVMDAEAVKERLADAGINFKE